MIPFSLSPLAGDLDSPRPALWMPAALLITLLLGGAAAVQAQDSSRLRDALAHPGPAATGFVTLMGPDTLRARLAVFLGSLRSAPDSIELPTAPRSPEEAAELSSHHLHLRRRLSFGVEYRGYYIFTDSTDPSSAFTAPAVTFAVRTGSRYLLLPRAAGE